MGTPNTSLPDVEQWATTTVPVMLGQCVRQDDYGPFCVSHDSGWRDEGVCHWVHDRQVFACDVVTAWQARPAAAAAKNWQQGTIDDLAAQVRVLEEDRDG